MWQIFSPCQYHSTNTTHSSSPSPGDIHTQHCSCRISGEHRTDKYFQFLWSLSAKHTENCTATSAGTNPVSGPLLPTFQYFSRSWLFYGAESFKLVKKSPAVFTTARHLSLPWARQTHSTLWHPVSATYFEALPSKLRLQFPNQNHARVSPLFVPHSSSVCPQYEPWSSPSRNSVQPLSLAPSSAQTSRSAAYFRRPSAHALPLTAEDKFRTQTHTHTPRGPVDMTGRCK